jgi:hypothetical protein
MVGSPAMMSRAFALLVGLVAVGCGDNIKPANDASEGFVEDMPPAGAIPQVVNSGGPVLPAPIVQPIFFGSAADTPTTQPYVEAFLAQLEPSLYWQTVGEEYGVGKMTVMPSIVSTDAVPTSDADLATYLSTQLDGTHAGWPMADVTSTIYMVQLPQGQAFSGACTSFAGYHSEAADSSATGFSYAVIANCGASGGSASALDEVTVTISHELIEASTDPKVVTNPAWESTDSDQLAWSREAGAEVGDMCEWTPSAQQPDVDGAYMVQRIWSNKSALAGHDPCVPVLDTPYFNAAPTIGDTSLSTRNGSIMVQGLTIATGATQDITFTLFSDAPVAADWDVAVIDGAELLEGDSSFSFDYGRVTTGHNGQQITVAVKREKAASSHGNLLFVENKPASDPTQVPSYWWIFVQ